MAKRRENVSGLCLRGGKQGFPTAACVTVTLLGGQGQISGWCSRAKAVPKSTAVSFHTLLRPS